jgi:hypothetical protein
MDKPPIRRAPSWKLQRMFNKGRYWERAQEGEFQQVLMAEGKSSPTHEPPGTRSQLISYRDANGNEVARVHQYLRPDGTIGASGRPDPKRLMVNGIVYIYQQTKPKS